MTIGKLLCFAGSAVIGLAAQTLHADNPANPADNRLVVHEWGTFTALQDERGKAIGGINTDDEPVPGFVHNLHAFLLQSPSQLPPTYFKGWPRCDKDVIVRLETPVIYFHPPRGSAPMHVNVDVEFKGGWLTQFYPDAKPSAPGLKDDMEKHGILNDQTLGSLSWHDLTIGTDRQGPPTTERVWTAPREVDAANLTTPAGESERYLFYRGVGHMNAPLQVSRTSADRFIVRADWSKWVEQDQNFAVGPLWLVDVREDGTCAVRTIDPIKIRQRSPDPMAEFPATFAATDYRADNLAVIRGELKKALVREGLYGDEADGLLNTWEVSYFKRPGLRLFFMVPPVWTQHYLPLRISQSAYITRVMIGRIELVTPHQRELLAQVSRGPASNPRWLNEALQKLMASHDSIYRDEFYRRAFDGKQPLVGMDIQMPADYRAYLGLGRFRNALILEELKNHPTPELAKFVKNYELEGSN